MSSMIFVSQIFNIVGLRRMRIFALLSMACLLSLVTRNVKGDGVDLYIDACQHHGRNGTLFFSGIASFTVTEKKQHADITEVVRKFNIRICFDGNDPGLGKRHVDREDVFGNKIFSLCSSATPDKQLVIYSLPGDEQVDRMQIPTYVVSDTRFSIPEFMKFGRIQGDVPWTTIIGLLDFENLGKFVFTSEKVELFKRVTRSLNEKGAANAFQIEKEELYDSEKGKAKVLATRNKEGRLIRECWVDETRGYICPIIREYSTESGEIIFEYLSSEYFQESNTQLWYPKRYIEKAYNAELKHFLVTEYAVKNIEFNTGINEDEFVVSIPKNSFVLDDRSDNRIKKYLATDSGSLNVSAKGIDLSTKQWLDFDSEYDNRKDLPIESASAQAGYHVGEASYGISDKIFRVFLFFIGLSIVVGVVVHKLLTKRHT